MKVLILFSFLAPLLISCCVDPDIPGEASDNVVSNNGCFPFVWKPELHGILS